MFKKIAKIFGLVLLAFVVVIGAVVGFMALRGDFEKKKVKPTAISFNISETELIFDAIQTSDKVYSFVINAEPVTVTETECTVTISDPTLITFVTRKDGQWVKYNSNKFYVNKPIYFQINDVTPENESQYNDGVVEITVKDASGLLKANVSLQIDRSVTSISIKDLSNNDNNLITNGLFNYELGKAEDEVVTQTLEAINFQDYPLEVITAPLKASKPFANKEAKIYEMYYIKDSQQKLVTTETEEGQTRVVLKSYDNHGNEVEEDCNFLKYDTTRGIYVLNGPTGTYQFVLATYPTYKVQETLLSDENLSFTDRLKMMVIKNVFITVSGTSADEIYFDQLNNSLELQLLKNNQLVANDNSKVNNLGLVLEKGGGTEILGRYEQLRFLDNDCFADEIEWVFKQALIVDGEQGEGEKLKYLDNEIILSLNSSKRKAAISGLNISAGDDTYNGDYDVELTCVNYTWEMQLIRDGAVVIDLLLEEDATKHLLRLQVENDSESLAKGLTKVQLDDGYNFYLDLQYGDNLIVGGQDKDGEGRLLTTYGFKTLKRDALYLAMLDKTATTNVNLVNDKFVTSVAHNGPNSLINIMPVDANCNEGYLYAIVVNDDGSLKFTTESCYMIVNMVESNVIINNGEDEISLPMYVVPDGFVYGGQSSVRDLFAIEEGASYGNSQAVMFAPEYTLLESKPDEWGQLGFKVYEYDPATSLFNLTKDTEYDSGKSYYVKNNYEMIKSISYTKDGIEYYLIGYFRDGSFMNYMVPTGPNYHSKLYPAVIKTKYIKEEGRLQTASEYVQELLVGKKVETVDVDSREAFAYDQTLNIGDKITSISNNAYLATTDEAYNPNKKYYIYYEGLWQQLQADKNTGANWESDKSAYYEKVNYLDAKRVFETYSSLNKNIQYYNLSSEGKLIGTEVPDQTYWTDASLMACYIVISHYQITDVAEDGANILVKTNAVYSGIQSTYKKEFKISKSSYNNAKINLNLNDVDLEDTKIITFNSYYDFSTNAETIPTVNLGGTYFEDSHTHKAQDVDGNVTEYELIAGYENIDLGWDETTTDPLKDKKIRLVSTMAHDNAGIVLGNVVSKLNLVAVKYNNNDVKMGAVSGSGSTATIQIKSTKSEMIQATTKYNDSIRYYNESGEMVDIDEDTINGWTSLELYKNYYHYAIVTEFKVNSTLGDGEYIKFEYNYLAGPSVYTIYGGEKLYILSRDIQEFSVDAGVVYLAPQESGKEGEVYQGKIGLLADVGFDVDANKYTYELYAIDNNGNKLYSDTVGTNPRKAGVNDVFRLTTEGGWIKAKPFYADSTTFVVESNDYVKFDDKNNIVFARENAYLDDNNNKVLASTGNITIDSNIGGAESKVNMWVDAGKFSYTEQGIQSTKTTTIQIPKAYIYQPNIGVSGTFIDAILKPTLAGMEIEKVNEDVSDKYTWKTELDNSIIIYPIDAEDMNAEKLVKIEFDTNIKMWTATRYALNKINIKLKFMTVEGEKEVELQFVSPYNVDPSPTNTKTNKIYSGTTFYIANTGYGINYVEKGEYDGTNAYSNNTYYILKDESYILVNNYKDNELVDVGVDGAKLAYLNKGQANYIKSGEKLYEAKIDTSANPLYSMTTETSGIFTIDYICENDGTTLEDTISAEAGRFLLVVPNVKSQTEIKFTIKFALDGKEEIVDEFVLEVLPNIIVTNLPTQTIQLDDYSNNVYDLNALKLAAYPTMREGNAIKYDKYDSPELLNNFDAIEYMYDVYVCAEKYILDKTYKLDNGKYVLIDNAEYNTSDTFYTKVDADILNYVFKYETTTKYIKENTYFIENGIYVLATEKQFNEGGREFYQRINQLQVKFIENIQTYYVDVNIYEDSAINAYVGTFKLEIDTKSQITNEHGGEVGVVEITANKTTSYLLEDLAKMFNLQRDGEIFEQSKNYVPDATYKLENGTFVKMTNDEGSGYYIKSYMLTDFDIRLVGINADKLVIEKIYDKTATYVPGGTYKDDGGKYVKISASEFVSGSQYYKVVGIKITYNGFGSTIEDTNNINITSDGYVDNISYYIIATFAKDDKHFDMQDNCLHTMQVLPYIIEPTTDVLLSGQAYELKGTNGLFAENVNIENFAFDITSGDNYKIEGEEFASKVKFNSSGNYYNDMLPIRLVYKDGSQLEYNQPFTVVNPVQVDISYPFNVDNQNLFTTFNTQLSNITISTSDNGINDILVDMAKLIGVEDNKIYTQYNGDFVDGKVYYYIDGAGNYAATTTKEDGVQYYTLIDGWANNQYIKYDIALKGTINEPTVVLLKNDKLLQMDKYQPSIFSVTTSNAEHTYYEYNKNTHTFDIVETIDADKLNNKIYFVKKVGAYEQYGISNIELVAMTNELIYDGEGTIKEAIVGGNVVRGNEQYYEITIPAALSSTGYLVFKVYANNTDGAYGYYILKFVDNSDFLSVIRGGLGREVANITQSVTENVSILEFINKYNDFENASHVNSGLIDTINYRNVHLFVVDNKDGTKLEVTEDVYNSYAGTTKEKEGNQYYIIYQPGELIPNNAELLPIINTKVLTLAVVISNDTSLVHICNYQICQTPDVDVKTGAKIEDVEDPQYYVYKAKALEYKFDGSNVHDLTSAEYFKVSNIDGDDTKVLDKITINQAMNMDGLIVVGNSVYLEGAQGKPLATIESNKITLNNPLGLDNAVSFYVTYTYTDKFALHLHITINPYKFTTSNSIIVGGSTFDTTYKLSNILGEYNKDYQIKYTDSNKLLKCVSGKVQQSTDNGKTWDAWNGDEYISNWNYSTGVLIFKSSFEVVEHKLEFVLTEIVPEKTVGPIVFTIEPQINFTKNSDSEYVDATKQTYAASDTLTVKGSYLYVNIYDGIDENAGLKIIEIKSNNASEKFITIKVASFSKIKFDVVQTYLINDKGEKQESADNLNYLIARNDAVKSLELQTSANLYFAHSIENVINGLNISVYDGDGKQYKTIGSMDVKISTTYSIDLCYRVTGAEYETIVNGKLSFEKGANKDIASNFFGTDSYSNIDNINKSRISIIVGGNTYYGYDNIVGLGLLDTNNPNHLTASSSTQEGTITSLVFTTDEGMSGPKDIIISLINSKYNKVFNYSFKVYPTLASSLDNIEYNKSLLQGIVNDKVVIRLTNSNLKNAAIELAYLNYLPQQGVPAYVVVSQSTEDFKTVGEVRIKNETKVIEIANYQSKKIAELTVYIITMKGVASECKVIISNLEVELGYLQANASEEVMFGGTGNNLLSGKDKDGQTRLTLEIADENARENILSKEHLEYKGATLQYVPSKPNDYNIDYAPTNKDLIVWDGDKLMFSTLDVAETIYVTMIFDIKNNNEIIYTIFYKLKLQNARVISIGNLAEDEESTKLYLGSISTKSGAEFQNYTYIHVTDEALKPSTSNPLHVRLFRKYYDSNGNVQQVEETLTDSNFGEYLDVSLAGMDGVNYGRVGKSSAYPGAIVFRGNPSGSFTFTISTKSGYSKSITVYLSNYEVVNTLGNGINDNNGGGYVSGTQIDFFNTDTTNINADKYAFNVYKLIGNDGTKDNVSAVINNDEFNTNFSIDYQIKIFDNATTIAEIINSSDWNSIPYIQLKASEGVSQKLVLPDVEYSSIEGQKLYQIVSIRMTTKYNNKSNDNIDNRTYFVHYRVYNDAWLKVNEPYSKNEKVITYGESDSSWESGDKIILMGNNGLYTMTQKLLEVPNDWETNIDNYYIKTGDGYKSMSSVTYFKKKEFESGDGYEYEDDKLTLVPDLAEGTLCYVKLSDVPDNLSDGDYYYSIYETPEGHPIVSCRFTDNEYYKLNNIAQYFRDKGTEKPGDWGSTYYYFDESSKEYKQIADASADYEPNKQYYKIENKYIPVEKYVFSMIINGNVRYITNITFDSDNNCLKGVLPNDATDGNGVLFSNDADFAFSIYDGGTDKEIYLDADWSIKSNITIVPVSQELLKLNKVFYEDEIGTDLYYNGEVIGILKNAIAVDGNIDNIVKLSDSSNANKATAIKDVDGDGVEEVNAVAIFKKSDGTEKTINGFQLYEVTYEYNGGTPNSVFNVVKTYKVLSGRSHAVSFNYNGGNYYINLNIDDSALTEIDMSKNISIYYTSTDDWEIYSRQKKNDTTSNNTYTLTEKVDDANVEIDTDLKVKLSNLDSIKENFFVSTEFEYKNISNTEGSKRDVNIYFNIIIKPKDITNDGYVKCDTLTKDDFGNIDKAIKDNDGDIEDVELKQKLLNLITFRSKDVATDVTTLSYWTVTLSGPTGDVYTIVYNYKNIITGETFKRTLKIKDTL